MDDARIPTGEQLMAELGWLRRLARARVIDDARVVELQRAEGLLGLADPYRSTVRLQLIEGYSSADNGLLVKSGGPAGPKEER